MSGKLISSLLTAGVALIAAGSVGVVSAGSGGTLYTPTGAPRGSVSIVAAGGGESIAVSLHGAQANTTYNVCIDTPLLDQMGACAGSSAAPTVFCFTDPISLLPVCETLGVSAAVVAGTVTTDASGNGTTTVAVPEVLSVTIVNTVNSLIPGDTAQAVVVVGP